MLGLKNALHIFRLYTINTSAALINFAMLGSLDNRMAPVASQPRCRRPEKASSSHTSSCSSRNRVCVWSTDEVASSNEEQVKSSKGILEANDSHRQTGFLGRP